jgi:hypothetical protein
MRLYGIILFISSFAVSSWLSILSLANLSASNSIRMSGVTQILSMFLPKGVYRLPIVYLSDALSVNSSMVWIDHLPKLCVPMSFAPTSSCKANAIISPADAVNPSMSTTVGSHSKLP